jgi:hypothetical protein
MDVTKNIVCASCGCIDHHQDKFTSLCLDNSSLRLLQVNPSVVPFDFGLGIPSLDEANIMIDPAGVIDSRSCVLACNSCQKSLQNNKLPPKSLDNYRWTGSVPPQLQDLTWMEELLIA